MILIWAFWECQRPGSRSEDGRMYSPSDPQNFDVHAMYKYGNMESKRNIVKLEYASIQV